MSIEASTSTNDKIYRINPYSPREVDWRYNKRGARWQRFGVYLTPESALKVLWDLRKNDEDE